MRLPTWTYVIDDAALPEGGLAPVFCHDWRFDVRSGTFADAPELGIQVYAAKSEAGKLVDPGGKPGMETK